MSGAPDAESYAIKWVMIGIVGIALAISIGVVGFKITESNNVEACLNKNGVPHTGGHFSCEMKK